MNTFGPPLDPPDPPTECKVCGEFECEHIDAEEAALEDYLEMRAEERRHGQ